MRKLDDTANNLTRINDIRSEVDAQVEPLAQAAAKTQQFERAKRGAAPLPFICTFAPP